MAFSPATGKFPPLVFTFFARVRYHMTHQWRGNFYAAFEPRHDQEKPHEKGNATTQAQTDKYKKGARTLYCIYSFSRTFRNTLSVPSTRNLARVQIAAPLCRVFANMMILCAQSPRRPEIQANRLKTREAVCCTHLHPLEPRLTYDSQDSSQGTRLE